MEVIVGGVIEKNGKYLLVQEAKKKCYGKWNCPAGHLKENETLEEGALREIKEETGCDVELNGICYIAYGSAEGANLLLIVYDAKLINEDIKFDKDEILDVKWFDYEEIVNKMDDKLREKHIKASIINQKNNIIAPKNIIDVWKK